MIDPENRVFRKELMKNLVQFPRRSQIAPERFFHHDPSILRGARMRQAFRYGSEHTGRNREIVQRPLRRAESLAQLGEGSRVAVIAIHVLKQGHQLREGSLVQAAVLGDALASARPELVEVPSRLRYSDDGNRQIVALHQGLQRGEDLLVGKISGCAKEYKSVGLIHTLFIAWTVVWSALPRATAILIAG
jgi:hypothetical protein